MRTLPRLFTVLSHLDKQISQVAQPANAEPEADVGLISGSGRSLGGENGNLLQFSHLENPMERGTWQVTGHRVTKSWTPLSEHVGTLRWALEHTHMCVCVCIIPLYIYINSSSWGHRCCSAMCYLCIFPLLATLGQNLISFPIVPVKWESEVLITNMVQGWLETATYGLQGRVCGPIGYRFSWSGRHQESNISKGLNLSLLLGTTLIRCRATNWQGLIPRYVNSFQSIWYLLAYICR